MMYPIENVILYLVIFIFKTLVYILFQDLFQKEKTILMQNSFVNTKKNMMRKQKCLRKYSQIDFTFKCNDKVHHKLY